MMGPGRPRQLCGRSLGVDAAAGPLLLLRVFPTLVRLFCPVTFLLALSGSILAVPAPPARATAPVAQVPGEVRALWVVRDSIATPASIAHVVEHAVANGFNTLLVQVRGRGDAYFADGLEPRAQILASQAPSFDPLSVVLEAAHRAGLKVHGWVNVNLIASAALLPSSRDHVLHRHPEWLMIPRVMAQELARSRPDGPGYVGRLARWTRGQPEDLEGLYLSPIVPGAADYTVAVLRDVAKRYPLDGVHLDYVRYPGPEFDYGALALAEFRTSLEPSLPSPERFRLTARAREDVLAWVDAFPAQWADFRRSRLTALVMKIRTALRAARPGLVISAAVVPDASAAFGTRFQDWRWWAESGLLDVLCPMAYTTDVTVFRRQIDEAVRIAAPASVWAGIGAYRLTSAQTVAHIEASRGLGARGVALFSYDAIAARGADAYFDAIRRAAFSGGVSSQSQGR
jgi:uncharacterized lipoprotein YddW (UPF0748 family)